MRNFYREYIGEAYIMSSINQYVTPKIKLRTEILPLSDLSKKVTNAIIKLHGLKDFLYLRLIYGSPKTFITLLWAGEKLVHIEWVIPSKKMKKRFPFLPQESYMISAVLTIPAFRGNNIFSYAIQQTFGGIEECDEYWILVGRRNRASIKAIEKSGAKHVGHFIQKRYFWGLLNKTRYFSNT